jgi:hypothetical protein
MSLVGQALANIAKYLPLCRSFTTYPTGRMDYGPVKNWQTNRHTW